MESGNHDEFSREFIDLTFGDIEILDEDVHTTAQELRLLVLHGDRFDGVIQHSKWLAHLSDSLYQLVLWLNNHFNRLLHRLGLHYCRSRSTLSTRSRMPRPLSATSNGHWPPRRAAAA